MRFWTVLVALSLPCSTALPQRAVHDPLTLFAKMMPVLSHERCANCHGATNPLTGDYHPGAIKPSAKCESCHTATDANGIHHWRLAPEPFAFFNKTTRQLCQHFEALGNLNDGMAFHLETDHLIGLAFIGRRGDAVNRSFAKPPPMSRPEFVRAYRTWFRDGGGACSAWEGTITRTETIASDTMPGSGPNSRNITRLGDQVFFSWQTGTHSTTVTIKAGVATVSTTLNGEKNQRSIARRDGCESIDHIRDAYSLVSSAAPEPNAASDDTAGPLVAIGDGSVRVGVADDGSYRIHVVPPRETTRVTSTTTNTNSCGVALPVFPASTETYDWPEWVFEITDKLSDPKNRRQLKGQSVIEVESSYDPSFGLAYHAAVARLDGSPLKFRITTTWNLKRAF